MNDVKAGNMDPFRWKRRARYFVVGLTVALCCAFLDFFWMEIVPYGAFDRQPPWLKVMNSVIGWIPWLLAAGVFALRLWRFHSMPAGFYLLGTATPLILVVSWVLVGSSVENRIHSRDFDATLWRANESVEHDPMWPPRLTMVDDLVESGRLDGLSQEQVIALLGSPEHGEISSGEFIYWVGPERGFIRVDSEWLAITFDSDGKVGGYRLTRD